MRHFIQVKQTMVEAFIFASGIVKCAKLSCRIKNDIYIHYLKKKLIFIKLTSANQLEDRDNTHTVLIG